MLCFLSLLNEYCLDTIYVLVTITHSKAIQYEIYNVYSFLTCLNVHTTQMDKYSSYLNTEL